MKPLGGYRQIEISHEQFNGFVSEVVSILHSVNHVVMDIYRKTSPDISYKQDNSPVTIADI